MKTGSKFEGKYTDFCKNCVQIRKSQRGGEGRIARTQPGSTKFDSCEATNSGMFIYHTTCPHYTFTEFLFTIHTFTFFNPNRDPWNFIICYLQGHTCSHVSTLHNHKILFMIHTYLTFAFFDPTSDPWEFH